MRAAAVVNLRAGAVRAGRRWPDLARRLKAAIPGVECCFTEGPGQGALLAEKLARAGFDPVIAAGGDGTVNEVVNGLVAAACDVRLGVLPLASGGDFARSLGLGGVRHALETLMAGEAQAIDVARARFGPSGGTGERHFVNVASVGLGAEVARAVETRWRALPGRLRYLAAAVPRLGRGKGVNASLWLDGEAAGTFPITTVALANGCYQGGGICIAPQAKLADGQIDVTVVEHVSLAEVARHLPLLFSGAIYSYPKVHHYRAARVRVEAAADTPVELDGEAVGAGWLEAELLPRRLRLIRPKGVCGALQ